ncbi:MAG: hypothetical protein ABFC85_11540 [Rectinema sp.]
MKNKFMAIIDMLTAILSTAGIRAKRATLDLFADRIRQAATEPNLLLFGERLIALVDAAPSGISQDIVSRFVVAAGDPEAPAILAWLSEFPRVAAMLAALQDPNEREAAIGAVEIRPASAKAGAAISRGEYLIPMTVTCLTPLAHGGDAKAGNSTLFRRMNVLSTEGSVLSLPFYSGNSLRGIVRDLLADHFVSALGLIPRRDKPILSLWFFHALYAGGALSEGGDIARAAKKLGGGGNLKTEGLREFRDMLPMLSLLGCAIGNRIICGRAQFGDLRPCCREWGNGEQPANSLMEWTYLTRREDLETHEEHTGMIATTETLKAGVAMSGGIDLDAHVQEIESAALGRGLLLLQEKGWIGAENRRDLGKVRIEYENPPDPTPYDDFIARRKDDILAFLKEIAALPAKAEQA